MSSVPVRRWSPAALLWVALAASCATVPAAAPRSPASPAPPPSPSAEGPVDAAIAALQGIEPERLTPPQRAAKDAELDAAWKTLRGHRELAVPRPVAALAADQRRPTPDAYFRMDASALIRELRGLEAAVLHRRGIGAPKPNE